MGCLAAPPTDSCAHARLLLLQIVGLVDYFETRSNLYLVFDLCTGGELFDRICAKGSYYERCVLLACQRSL